MKTIIHYSRSSLILLFNWLVGGSIAIACFTFLHIVYLYLIPAGWVFQYKSIEPTQQTFEHFETIKIKTTADWYRDANVQFIDTLRCPPVYYVSQSESKTVKRAGDKARGEWFYGRETPLIDSQCYMDSTIIATIEYGITKIQTISSVPFLIH